MIARRSAAVMATTLAVTGLAPLAAAPTAAAPTAATAACGSVVSATKNGAALDTSWISTICTPGADGASSDVGWNVWSGPAGEGGSSLELGAGARSDTYVITIDTGSIVPRVTDTKGTGVIVNRTPPSSGHPHWRVTITAKPVLVTGGCDQGSVPWTCPSTAESQREGYLGGWVTDYGSWEDTAQRNAFLGMDYSSNIDAGSIPPQIVSDARGEQMILLELANSHFLQDGSTLVKGGASVVIPNAFLKEVYGIDSPGSLTTAGLSPVITGSGSGSASVVDIGGALRVDLTNMTFSKRNVRIHRGKITPTKPGNLTSKRVSASAVKLTYAKSKARGSKIVGYTATCTAKTGRKHVVTVKDKAPSTKVTGLKARTAYTCKVWARSKAGKGATAKVSVAKRP
ncbi:fibronectin type III domain-containing protein [Sporichthya polymorpha]|uniref:fibronectin type III domain-containing protein n=1 Tax=Sporichthya polymorpha TaxID=35751 RepID=UPI00039D7C42|nr:fibronectin type III domain-containing protein [Sporichthya polymorpha]